MNSNSIRVGIIGAGFIGKLHAEISSKLEDVSVVAILDQDEERARKLSELVGGSYCTDLEEFFTKYELDAVEICTPTYMHEELIVKALEAGCHVLCEKPLTLSSASALRIKKKTEASGKAFMVGQVIRFWPQYVKIREMVLSGDLGEIESIYAYRINQKPTWSDWFLYPDKGGGALFDLHIHDIDYIYSLFGMPEEVYSRGNQGPYGAWDSVTTTLSWKHMRAVVEADYTYPDGFPFQFGFRIRGTKAALQYEFSVKGNVESKDVASEVFLFISQGIVKQIDCSEMDEAYKAELDYFYSCIKNEIPIQKATISDALEVLKLVEKERKSLEARLQYLSK